MSVCVRPHAYLVRTSCGVCSTCQVISVLRGLIPLQVLGVYKTFERTPLDKYVRWMNVTRALVCGSSGSRAVCPVLTRSASCGYPVWIRWCPFDLNCEWSTTGQVTEFPRRVPHAHSVFVQRTFCPFLIRYMFVLSVIQPLHVRELTVLCMLLVWYVCALYDFRDDLHHTETTSITGSTFFAFFLSVRCPLPSSEYATAP